MPTFTEPERFLLRQWTSARLLEDAMKGVREKHHEILVRAVEEVQRVHKELDLPQNNIGKNHAYLGIGKLSWPLKDNKCPAGFWIQNLGLEELISKEHEHPYRLVWIHTPPADPKEVESKLRKGAEKLLKREELGRLEIKFNTREKDLVLWSSLEQSKEELLGLLVENEASGFISCMLEHFEWMAKFTSVVDEIVMTSPRKRK